MKIIVFACFMVVLRPIGRETMLFLCVSREHSTRGRDSGGWRFSKLIRDDFSPGGGGTGAGAGEQRRVRLPLGERVHVARGVPAAGSPFKGTLQRTKLSNTPSVPTVSPPPPPLPLPSNYKQLHSNPPIPSPLAARAALLPLPTLSSPPKTPRQ